MMMFVRGYFTNRFSGGHSFSRAAPHSLLLSSPSLSSRAALAARDPGSFTPPDEGTRGLDRLRSAGEWMRLRPTPFAHHTGSGHRVGTEEQPGAESLAYAARAEPGPGNYRWPASQSRALLGFPIHAHFQPGLFSVDTLNTLQQFDIGVGYLIERGKKRQRRLDAARDQTRVTQARSLMPNAP